MRKSHHFAAIRKVRKNGEDKLNQFSLKTVTVLGSASYAVAVNGVHAKLPENAFKTFGASFKLTFINSVYLAHS